MDFNKFTNQQRIQKYKSSFAMKEFQEWRRNELKEIEKNLFEMQKRLDDKKYLKSSYKDTKFWNSLNVKTF